MLLLGREHDLGRFDEHDDLGALGQMHISAFRRSHNSARAGIVRARAQSGVRVWLLVSATRLILMCGLPAAGKTTLARQLAKDRNAVRLTKDEWLWALGASPWDTPTNDKIERELWRIAQDILSLGVSVVLDFGLWARVERDEMRTVARRIGVGVELHYLNASIDELWRRIQTRNLRPPWDSEPILRAHLVEWASTFQVPDAAELALFDPPPEPN
jgi:predicted kinase